MSLDLTLFFNKWPDAQFPSLIASERLSLTHCDHMINAIQHAAKEHARPVPSPVLIYQDEGLRETTTDAYGDPLTQIDAALLATALARGANGHDRVNPEADPRDNAWNRAVQHFVATLPPDSPVTLYWC